MYVLKEYFSFTVSKPNIVHSKFAVYTVLAHSHIKIHIMITRIAWGNILEEKWGCLVFPARSRIFMTYLTFLCLWLHTDKIPHEWNMQITVYLLCDKHKDFFVFKLKFFNRIFAYTTKINLLNLLELCIDSVENGTYMK